MKLSTRRHRRRARDRRRLRGERIARRRKAFWTALGSVLIQPSGSPFLFVGSRIPTLEERRALARYSAPAGVELSNPLV